MDIRIVSSDSFGTAREELAGVVTPDILTKERHDLEKQDYVKTFDLKHVAAFGNGNNCLLYTSRQPCVAPPKILVTSQL